LTQTTVQKRIDDQPTISREMIREAEGILHRHLKRVGLKHTAQRDTILRTFLETREHLSSDELHRLVKKQDGKIGFTTVYRTMTASPVMSTSTIGAATTTWFVQNAAVRWSSSLLK
jgi:hypothetical protein